jgi:high-affinity nickel-transport protein
MTIAEIHQALSAAAAQEGALSLLATALVLGIRHGIDWDHIAAITDITSTTAAADAGERAHEVAHARGEHDHPHGGAEELAVHRQRGRPVGGSTHRAPAAAPVPTLAQLGEEQRRALALGTLYALGHGTVVALLGVLALGFGALLPDWVDPLMGRVVGVTLIVLGVWVMYSLYTYVRHGTEFRLRSRWMVVFALVRNAWRRFRARLHGHEHAADVEMSSYGPRTAFGVGMIHGIGAETGTQVLIIAAIGGASGIGLGVPMMFAFILGLLISNSAIVIITATGFVASQMRQRIYLVAGAVAGIFSLVVGALFLFELDATLPDLDAILRSIGLGS